MLYDGKFERTFLLALAVSDQVGSTLVPVPAVASSQAKWWIRKILSRRDRPASIPDPRHITPASSIHLFSDAAGGGGSPYQRGYGGVVYGKTVSYTYHYWEDRIQDNGVTCGGHRVSRKMTFLEAVAALATLVCAPDTVRNSAVTIHVDNIGTVFGWRKGSSRCPYAATVIKAIRDVARALNIRLDIVKITRCSNEGSIAADTISKGSPMVWVRNNPGVRVGYLSRTLTAWLRDPFPSRLLGVAVADELSRLGPVLSWDREEQEEICDLVIYPCYL